jgi:hypothetical protein
VISSSISEIFSSCRSGILPLIECVSNQNA